MTAKWQAKTQVRVARAVAPDSQVHANVGALCRSVLNEGQEGEIGRGRIAAPGDAPVE